MTRRLLEIEGLNISFGHYSVVRDVSLALAPSEKLAIIGESGSGKSVTAMSILRLLDHSATATGEIRFDGKNILSLSAKEMKDIRGRRIAMIFQDPMTSLNPVFTIFRQLSDVLQAHAIETPEGRRAHLAGLLAQVGIRDPDHCLSLYPHQLSGGMRQRVMIALAIACDPDILIADEPTTALDVTVQVQITRLLISLCEQRGLGLIFISHNLDLVGEFADRIAVMQNGECVEQGTAEQVMGNPQAPYTRRLLAAIPRLSAVAAAAPAETGRVVLETWQASKSYPRARSGLARLFDKSTTNALTPTDLKIREGEVIGIVGESGSGKSTLARLLIGLDRPTTGSVMLEGHELSLGSRKDRIRLSAIMQLVFQGSQTSLNPRKTIRRALIEAGRAAGNAVSASPEDLMRQVKLDPALLDRFPHQLSGGQRQRIGIARALSTKPAILIADEPTSALDVSIQKEIIELLKTLHREMGMTMVVISHDLGLIGTMCDRVAVMQAGRIVEQGPAGQILSAPQNEYTRTLIDAVPQGIKGRGRYAARTGPQAELSTP
ncbi:MAG: microcin ABC transporter ATP-binding protein [Acidobacteria bacterium]|nr:microcin ABC transporter ATP-binding protein [Acidobacteriota bacterium]